MPSNEDYEIFRRLNMHALTAKLYATKDELGFDLHRFDWINFWKPSWRKQYKTLKLKAQAAREHSKDVDLAVINAIKNMSETREKEEETNAH